MCAGYNLPVPLLNRKIMTILVPYRNLDGEANQWETIVDERVSTDNLYKSSMPLFVIKSNRSCADQPFKKEHIDL